MNTWLKKVWHNYRKKFDIIKTLKLNIHSLYGELFLFIFVLPLGVAVGFEYDDQYSSQYEEETHAYTFCWNSPSHYVKFIHKKGMQIKYYIFCWMAVYNQEAMRSYCQTCCPLMNEYRFSDSTILYPMWNFFMSHHQGH